MPTLNVGYLEIEGRKLLRSAKAPKTTRTYEGAMKCFEEFRLMHGIDDQFPIASSNISLFIAFLSIRGYAASTVATYISAIGYYHKVNGFIDPTDNFVIREMIEGFRRKGPKCKDIRQPITLPMLRLILASLDSVCSSQFKSLAFKAAFSVASFGFMRVGEIVADSRNLIQNSVLRLHDVSLTADRGMQVTFRHAKNNQCGPPQVIWIPRSADTAICPVRAMQVYLRVRPACGSILMCHFDGSPITRGQFCYVLGRSIQFCGWPVTDFKSHSFRIGAATRAAELGIADEIIMQMGRWKSAAFKSYIRIPVISA